MITYRTATIIVVGSPGAYGYRWVLGELRHEVKPQFSLPRLAAEAAQRQIDRHLRLEQEQKRGK